MGLSRPGAFVWRPAFRNLRGAPLGPFLASPGAPLERFWPPTGHPCNDFPHFSDDFKNIFIDPIRDALNEGIFFTRKQDLLKNGEQTVGNLFAEKNNFLGKIKDIIHLEIDRYRIHFKENKGYYIYIYIYIYTIYT